VIIVKFEEIIDKYPVLKEDYFIHKGAVLSYVRKLKSSVEKEGFEYEVNDSSLDITKLCNGLNSFKDIVNNLSKTYDTDYDKIGKIVFDFIDSNSFFQINDFPLESPYMPIKGSADLQIPTTFTIELTNYCNYSCIHCYNGSNPDKEGFINTDDLINFLEYIKEFDPNLELTGGEPFAHPDIKKIIDYSCKNFESVAVLTNGSLTQEYSDFLAQYDNLTLLVSLYSYRPEYMDWFTNTENWFDIVINNIKELVKKGVYVSITLLMTPANLKDLHSSVKMIKSLGVENVRIGIIMPIGRAKNKDLHFTKGIFDKFDEEVEKVNKDFPGFIYRNPVNKQERINCGVAADLISINYDGNVKFCNITPDNFTIGNVLTSPESFFKKLAKYPYYELPEPKKEICQDCHKLNFCNKCIARGLHAKNDNNECTWYNNIFKPIQDTVEKINQEEIS